MTSRRIFFSVAVCALPRPSAMASAKFAKSRVNQSQALTRPVNESAGAPAGCKMRSRKKRPVVSTEPTCTTNITGFLATLRGWSLRTLSTTAGPKSAALNIDVEDLVVAMIRTPSRRSMPRCPQVPRALGWR